MPRFSAQAFDLPSEFRSIAVHTYSTAAEVYAATSMMWGHNARRPAVGRATRAGGVTRRCDSDYGVSFHVALSRHVPEGLTLAAVIRSHYEEARYMRIPNCIATTFIFVEIKLSHSYANHAQREKPNADRSSSTGSRFATRASTSSYFGSKAASHPLRSPSSTQRSDSGASSSQPSPRRLPPTRRCGIPLMSTR